MVRRWSRGRCGGSSSVLSFFKLAQTLEWLVLAVLDRRVFDSCLGFSLSGLLSSGHRGKVVKDKSSPLVYSSPDVKAFEMYQAR